jgi:hypothetical protein
MILDWKKNKVIKNKVQESALAPALQGMGKPHTNKITLTDWFKSS